MFNNTLELASKTTSGSDLSVRLVDGPTNRRTLRSQIIEGQTYELSIAHQSSNENPGFDTQRSVVRLSATTRDAETGKDYTVYAQFIMGIPRDVIEVAQVIDLASQLVSFLMIGDNTKSVMAIDMDAGDLAGSIGPVITRLYAGEP